MSKPETIPDTESVSRKFNFREIELRWQERWQESGLFTAPELPDSDKEKYYMLVMFAYP